MTNFIEELYYGNIDPKNGGFEEDESVQRKLRTISVSEDWLTGHLAGEEKERFLDFADAWSAYNGDATLDGFITGFRLGARFVLDRFVSAKPLAADQQADKEGPPFWHPGLPGSKMGPFSHYSTKAAPDWNAFFISSGNTVSCRAFFASGSNMDQGQSVLL